MNPPSFITSHQLAHRLLDMPDLPVCLGNFTPRFGEQPLRKPLRFQVNGVLLPGGEDMEVLFVDEGGAQDD